MRRNQFLMALGGWAAASCLPARASGADRLSVLIPASAGGGWDATGRALGAAMVATGRYREAVYDNQGGAAGTLGLAAFVQAARGQPNALLIMGAVMIGGLVSSKTPLRQLQQCTPIARLTSEYSAFAVAAGSPIRSLGAVAERLRQAPGSVRFGGGSKASTEHIAVSMFARSLRVPPREIRYLPHGGGADAVAALLKGEIDVVGGGYGELAQGIARGQLRLLGVTAQRRLPGLPDVPTLKEQGYDVTIGNWRGVYGAPGISDAQRAALTQAVAEAVKSPAWRQAAERHGWTPAFTTGRDFEAFVEFEYAATTAILFLSGML
jgi:putative tricarboxylic transport membrane protein